VEKDEDCLNKKVPCHCRFDPQPVTGRKGFLDFARNDNEGGEILNQVQDDKLKRGKD